VSNYFPREDGSKIKETKRNEQNNGHKHHPHTPSNVSGRRLGKEIVSKRVVAPGKPPLVHNRLSFVHHPYGDAVVADQGG
jgi:hypothetical protein